MPKRAGQRTSSGPDDLFVHDRAEAVVLQHAGAAELFGNGEPDDPCLAGSEHRVAVDLARSIPFLAVLGAHVALDEVLDQVAECLVVLVVDVAFHAVLPNVSGVVAPASLCLRADAVAWRCKNASHHAWHRVSRLWEATDRRSDGRPDRMLRSQCA